MDFGNTIVENTIYNLISFQKKVCDVANTVYNLGFYISLQILFSTFKMMVIKIVSESFVILPILISWLIKLD